MISKEEIAGLLPEYDECDNKYSVGTLLCVTGSRLMTGAAYFAARAALLSGVGLVYQACEKEALPILQSKLSEPVFCDNDFESISDKLKRANAVVIGCGLEICSHNEKILEYILREAKVPVVVDASALTMLSQNKELYALLSPDVILTPHEKEMERISGSFPHDRLKSAKTFAESHDSVLVLKGHNTLIAQKKQVFTNPTGNAGMAKGGYGDLLSGIIGAMLARGLSPIDAAKCGVYIHGLAGDIASERYGSDSAIPSLAAECIPDAIRSIKRKDV